MKRSFSSFLVQVQNPEKEQKINRGDFYWRHDFIFLVRFDYTYSANVLILKKFKIPRDFVNHARKQKVNFLKRFCTITFNVVLHRWRSSIARYTRSQNIVQPWSQVSGRLPAHHRHHAQVARSHAPPGSRKSRRLRPGERLRGTAAGWGGCGDAHTRDEPHQLRARQRRLPIPGRPEVSAKNWVLKFERLALIKAYWVSAKRCGLYQGLHIKIQK